MRSGMQNSGVDSWLVIRWFRVIVGLRTPLTKTSLGALGMRDKDGEEEDSHVI